jgi:hypothetical protein
MATDVLGFLWNTAGDATFKITDPGVGNLEFDTLDQETHEWNRDVTMNPVENGSPISDHIIRQPKKITVAGMISNSPITGVLTQLSNVIATGFDGEDRVNTAIKLLDSLYLSNELVTIYTKNYTYENMLIQSINIPRRVEDGDAVNFTVDALQVNIVSTATTELPPGVGVRKTDASKSGSSGKAGTSNSMDRATANRATPTKNNGINTGSILSQLGDGLSGAGGKLGDYLGKIIGNVTP